MENDWIAIEHEFVTSWDGIERFYVFNFFIGTPEWFDLSGISHAEFEKAGLSERIHHREFMKPIRALITEMRMKGYDRKLRAGQSLDSFVLSRSRKHGLRSDQGLLGITLLEEGGMHVEYCPMMGETKIEVHFSEVKLTSGLEQLLDKLVTHPID